MDQERHFLYEAAYRDILDRPTVPGAFLWSRRRWLGHQLTFGINGCVVRRGDVTSNHHPHDRGPIKPGRRTGMNKLAAAQDAIAIAIFSASRTHA
jgi:hypothetical protein